MDVIEKVASAIKMIEEARSVPLSASCVVHRGEMLEILDQVRISLPVDFDRAQFILREQEQILENARQSGDQIIASGREEVARMIEQTEIVAAARKAAERILEEVDQQAKREREEIESYIDSRLATLEVILTKTLEVVNRGRDRLGGVEEKHLLAELGE
ncbi:MAG: ATP synthase subunit B/B' [Actinomycetes bacterium]